MLCQKPFTRGMQAYPCGQCMPCRFNRRRLWTHRILLEQRLHSFSCFLTLTYSDQKLPRLESSSGPVAVLMPSDLMLFWKRLRKEMHPASIRYFAVGEYGDETWRPHYHAALFGYPPCSSGRTQYRRDGRVRCCTNCQRIHDIWDKGGILLGDLTDNSAQYVAGYVTKKLTARDDPRLGGRTPEFARMSLKPGIGADAMWEVSSTWMKFNLDTRQADVPVSLTHGKRNWPLGRYLRQQIRKQIGKDVKAPQEVIIKMEEELRPLLIAAQADPENPSLRSQLIKASKGKVASLTLKNRIYRKRGPL